MFEYSSGCIESEKEYNEVRVEVRDIIEILSNIREHYVPSRKNTSNAVR
jgi:hypothetical protein